MSHSHIKKVDISRDKKDRKKSRKVDEEVVCSKEEDEVKVESETESEVESSSSSSSSSSESDEDDKVSFSTTDILSNDPLYFVLSKIFMTEDNVSLATLIQQMNSKLDILIQKKHH